MKKIKIYTVTYNDNESLNLTLKTFFESDNLDQIEFEYFIINNHTNIQISDEFSSKVKLLRNEVRPDFSYGHLARNWNQALINGFQNIRKPDCDIVITTQDDILWNKDWVNKLLKIHESYSFYTCDFGDNFCSYTPSSVKKIGLWDERFCGITFQEADYFLRAVIFNGKNSSINDKHHKRVSHKQELVVQRQNPTKFRPHNNRNYSHKYTRTLFLKKWSGRPPHTWESVVDNRLRPNKNYKEVVYYPYFEKDIDKDLYEFFFEVEQGQSVPRQNRYRQET